MNTNNSDKLIKHIDKELTATLQMSEVWHKRRKEEMHEDPWKRRCWHRRGIERELKKMLFMYASKKLHKMQLN